MSLRWHGIAVLTIARALCGQAVENLEFQARTPEEYDAYLKVEAAPASSRIAATSRFLRDWPQSALRVPVLVWKMEAHRTANEGEAALAAAEEAVTLAGRHVPAIAGASELLVNLRGDTASLRRARELATQLLLLMGGELDVPRVVPLAAWLPLRRGYEARAWSVIGQAAFKQDRLPEAVEAFTKAVALEPTYDAARHYRYALLLQAAGRGTEARGELERVARDGPSELRERAKAALAKK